MSEAKAMTVRTVNFGEIDIPDEKIIYFKEGIPGFPQIRRFALLEFENLEPFRYLQSLEDPPIALLVVNPFLLQTSYHFQLGDSDADELLAEKSEDVSIFAVVTVPENLSDATINLVAPILINGKHRRGKQVILLDSQYSVKHPLFRTADSNRVGSK